MNTSVQFAVNKASEAKITGHLMHCDATFVPPLSERVVITQYTQKILSKAARIEAWSGATLVGLVAIYCNDRKKHIAYITSVSVLRDWWGKRIATGLLKKCIEYAKVSGMGQISLDVASDNVPAITLYEKNGFIADKVNGAFINMRLNLKTDK